MNRASFDHRESDLVLSAVRIPCGGCALSMGAMNLYHFVGLTGGWNVPPVANVTIANNVIDLPMHELDSYTFFQAGAIDAYAVDQTGLISSSLHQNLTVQQNFIADSPRSPVFIGNTTTASVQNNYFLNPNNNPQSAGVAPQYASDVAKPIGIEDSSGVATTNNTSDTTSGRVWVTDTQHRELAAYAPGELYRLNAYNLGALSNPNIMLTDSNGNTAPVAIKATSAHALDVTIPSSAALGGAYLTVTSGTSKYLGTLFIDSQDNIPTLNGCTYETSVPSSSVSSSASNLPILAVTQSGCSWQVLDNDAFVSPGAAYSATGVVSVGFAANSGATRSTILEIAGQQFTVTQAASSLTIQAIVDVWDYTSGLAPGEWVAIFGASLTTGTVQSWRVSGAQLPTTTGGTSVSFNGIAAPVLYASPGLMAVLVPAGVTPGPVQVVVQSGTGIGPSFSVTATATRPSVYAVPTSDGSSFFVTAALAGTATLIGNSSVDSRVARAALPGDALDLYTTGLGLTQDPSKFLTDQVFSGAWPVSANVTATIGNQPAQVLFAGLTSPGLYLVRIVVPAGLVAGPIPIQITAGTAQTASSLMLMIGTP
jgi:uncharacterized protein (TIGR03437 family)